MKVACELGEPKVVCHFTIIIIIPQIMLQRMIYTNARNVHKERENCGMWIRDENEWESIKRDHNFPLCAQTYYFCFYVKLSLLIMLRKAHFIMAYLTSCQYYIFSHKQPQRRKKGYLFRDVADMMLTWWSFDDVLMMIQNSFSVNKSYPYFRRTNNLCILNADTIGATVNLTK